jgi:hypothetical protein
MDASSTCCSRFIYQEVARMNLPLQTISEQKKELVEQIQKLATDMFPTQAKKIREKIRNCLIQRIRTKSKLLNFPEKTKDKY